MSPTRRVRTIGILVYDQVTALDVVGPADVFAAAPTGPLPSAIAPYRIVTIGLSGRSCTTESGLRLEASHLPASAPALDTLIVPGGAGLRDRHINQLAARFVLRRAAQLRRIASVCTGIYGVAPTGLLDGRRVTTHWGFADRVRTAFPKLRVEPNQIYLRDGKFYSSGGVTAGIDLCLALIEEDLGRTAALRVARELVVYMRRPGGQAQFSEPLRLQLEARDRFGDLVAHINEHLGEDLSVGQLARRMALSPRHFARRCAQELGTSPAALVQRLRLDAARERLLLPEVSVEAVARSLGFQSADVFRRAFERSFGLPPSAYRDAFTQTSTTSRRGDAAVPFRRRAC